MAGHRRLVELPALKFDRASFDKLACLARSVHGITCRFLFHRAFGGVVDLVLDHHGRQFSLFMNTLAGVIGLLAESSLGLLVDSSLNHRVQKLLLVRRSK